MTLPSSADGSGGGLRLFILVGGDGAPSPGDTDGIVPLERQLAVAQASSVVNDIVVITGDRGARIEEWLASRHQAVPVRTLFNPFHETTGSLVSLWCGRRLLEQQDFAISDGNHLHRNDAFARAAHAAARFPVALDIEHKSGVKAEPAGLAFVRGAPMRRRFALALDRLLSDRTNHGHSWLFAFAALAEAGVPVPAIPLARGDATRPARTRPSSGPWSRLN